MNRIASVLGTAVAILLGAAGAGYADPGAPPMVGCGGGYVGEPLGTHLHYRAVNWYTGSDPDDGSLGVEAPRSWSFVRTSHGEGRFHDSTGNDLLSLALVTEPGTPAAKMADAVRDLGGTPALKVTGQHVKKVPALGETWATLAYRWSNMGEPRSVKVRWIAYGTASDNAVMVLTVAGRAMDGNGLDALLAHATPKAYVAG